MNSRPNSRVCRVKGAQSFRAASLRPASVALSRARRSKPGHAELVRSTYTLPSVQGVKTGDLVPSEARPGVVSSSVVRIALRVPSRENHGDLPSQQRAMSDLGAPGGTRPIPNGSKCHARARTTRDPAALRPVPSRTRPLARKPARARFRKRHLTSRASPSFPPSAHRRPRDERRDERPREPLVTTGRRFRERYVPNASRDALPATSIDRAPSPARSARVLPCPLAHSPPFRPTKIPLATRPQARLSRPSGSEVSPAPSAARTRKPRRKRYVATLPSSSHASPRTFAPKQISPLADDPRAARPEDEF